MDVKNIPSIPAPVVSASAETREGEKRRQQNNRRTKEETAKKPLVVTAELHEKSETVSEPVPTESQLLDSKTVIELLPQPTRSVPHVIATFSRQSRRPKTKPVVVIDEKKLDRQA